MREFTQFLTALCVLAAVQYLAAALGVVLLILLLMAAIVHPLRTLQLLATVAALALAFEAPGHCAIAIGAAMVALTAAAHFARKAEAAPSKPLGRISDQRGSGTV